MRWALIGALESRQSWQRSGEQISALHGEHAPSSAVHDDEITGYGSHAHWRHTRPRRR